MSPDDAPPSGLPRPSRLLLVHAEPIEARSLWGILRDGFEVALATSAADAMARARSLRPDLIVLSVALPDQDGFATCQRIRASAFATDVPIVLVTSGLDAAAETRALESGAVDVISAPFNPSVLRARLSTLLRLRLTTEQAKQLAVADSLTGVANRRVFDETLIKEWRRCTRSEAPIALVLVDLDFFKRYNECYGRATGDACLQAVANCLLNCFSRPHDLVARLNGDTFACLLPETIATGAVMKATEMELAVRRLEITHEASAESRVMTVSIGVAATEPKNGGDAQSFFDAATEQRDLAKRAGRGQVKATTNIQWPVAPKH